MLYLSWEIPTRLSLVSSFKYLPATGILVPILNELTHIIDTQVGFIRWSLYTTIWSKHAIVLCFVSIENKQERKITKQKKIVNRLHNIHNTNYDHLDISMWYAYKGFLSLF